MAELLINRGADIEHTNCYDRTPLTLAACKADRKMCLFLISKGANLYPGESCDAPLSMYGSETEEGNRAMYAFFNDPGAGVESLRSFTPRGKHRQDLIALQAAWAKGPHPNARWERRKAFAMVLSENGFVAQSRRAKVDDAMMTADVPHKGTRAGARVLRARQVRARVCFTALSTEAIMRSIASFL